MRAVLLFVLALLVAVAPAAPAQGLPGGINLSWDQCAAAGGTAARLFACDTDAGADVLVASVVLPFGIPSLSGASMVLDFELPGGVTPPWWQVAPGQCRANGVRASFDPATFPVSGTCAPMWGEQAPVQAQRIEASASEPWHFRLSAEAAVPPGSEIALAADGTEWIVACVQVLHAKTTGPDACDGCLTGACIHLEEIYVQQPPGVGNYRMTDPYVSGWATHNAAVYLRPPAPVCATPALNRTWGAIKTLYR